MDRQQFSQIRRYLGKSQSQLARLLCVSPKTIQSFEHGLRQIPTYIERQTLVLLSLKRSVDATAKPCWEIKNCPSEWRDNCIVWEYKARYFCWFLNGTFCQGECQSTWHKKIEICHQCEVFQAMIPTIV